MKYIEMTEKQIKDMYQNVEDKIDYIGCYKTY